MIKVLRIINRFNLGGPTYNVAYLSRYLPEEFETLLVGGQKDTSEESSSFITDSLGLQPVIINEMKREINLFADIRAYRKLKKIIREFKPDVVHTHASKAGAIGRLAAHACGVPVIVHTFHGHVFHSYFGRLATAFYKTVERYLARISTAIIAISQIQKDELVRQHHICEAEKVHVIPLGFDLDRFGELQEEKRKEFRQKYSIAEDEIIVSIIGRIVPVKNHRLFIEAMKIVSQKTERKVRALIIGGGEDKVKMEEFARSINVSYTEDPGSTALLTFTSWIHEIDKALAGSDIIALTSFNEGTPVSLIEAQAASKPVVSTNVGGIADVVIAGESALLCNTARPQEFADLLLQLTENDALRRKMASAGRNHVLDRFHYSRLVHDMEKLYRKLLAQQPGL